jgi:hypothetical protein
MVYKQVCILGPDHNGAFREVLTEFPEGDDCLIIGDGKRNISLSEIEVALNGKINEATRIDICAQGGG